MSFFRQALGVLKKFTPFAARVEAPKYQYPKTREAAVSKLFTSAPTDRFSHYLASLRAAADVLYKRYALERKQWANRPKVKIGSMVRVLPGGRHALFESNIGLIRKPYVTN